MYRTFKIFGFLVLNLFTSFSLFSSPINNRTEKMKLVHQKAEKLLEKGFNAGDGYAQVWIRDLNTFLIPTIKLGNVEKARDILLKFLYFQGFDGNIPDGFETKTKNTKVDYYHVYWRYDQPDYVFHKNTVETDQESSLIQAIGKYIAITKDSTILDENINGKTVCERLELALTYLKQQRYNDQYGLIWGATTSDWGDVQPGHLVGTRWDEHSRASIDIYDNAMAIIALKYFNKFASNRIDTSTWKEWQQELSIHSKQYLWDKINNKFIPHIYLSKSPFNHTIDENNIFYTGGTILAIEADLLSTEEVKISLAKMIENQIKSGALTIGITNYPPYPIGEFASKGMDPYQYQNGGDWTWFGARIVKQLVRLGMITEAQNILDPFLDRVIKNNGFYEWYTVNGEPKGSASFKGSAGVLYEAIDAIYSIE